MGNANHRKKIDNQIEPTGIPSSKSPSRRSHFQYDQRTGESILIWLDSGSQENSLQSLHTRALLKQINNDRCLFFDRVDPFLSTMAELQSGNKNIICVISGSFAKEVIPKNIDIVRMIIFCQDYTKYQYLAEKSLSVIGLCTEYETLKNCIEQELTTLRSSLFSNRNYNSFTPLASSENTEYDGTYFSYMLFIDVLKQMPRTKQAKEIMLSKCKDYHRKDHVQLKHIEEFRNTYTPSTAIEWYVRNSFVYRLVNQAFRTADVTLWYLFRFYSIDLCAQLDKIHKEQNNQTCFTVYRGQGQLRVKEFESLQANIGGLISANGFFSTSTELNTARGFLGYAENTKDFKVVIFQINVDAPRLKNTTFVDVDKHTGRDYENEVLFSIGSIFKVNSVEYDSNLSAWKVEMTATDQGTQAIKARINTTREKFRNCNINLLFGGLLLDTRQYAKAESYFSMMLRT